MDKIEWVLAIAFSVLAILAAVGFVRFRQPVHAALCFAVVVMSGSGLYLLAQAPYTAAATVIVYAGATIIIFLFALMFAQRSVLQSYDENRANPFLSQVAAVSILAILIYTVSHFDGPTPATQVQTAASDQAASTLPSQAAPSVAALGRVMYTQYLWAIELAGAVLLVATLGAIQIARDEPNEAPPTKRTLS
jgi:NADH-quinone oxidoreductase subunit J